MDPLFIKERETLLQIDDRVFKIPEGFSLVRSGQYEIEVYARVKELAARFGVYFHGFRNGKLIQECLDCRHSLLTPSKDKEYRLLDEETLCKYKGNVQEIIVFSEEEREKEGKNSKFMAQNEPCALKDAFYRTLMEQGYLNRFLLKRVASRRFPTAKQVENLKSLLKRYIEEYKEMARG